MCYNFIFVCVFFFFPDNQLFQLFFIPSSESVIFSLSKSVSPCLHGFGSHIFWLVLCCNIKPSINIIWFEHFLMWMGLWYLPDFLFWSITTRYIFSLDIVTGYGFIDQTWMSSLKLACLLVFLSVNDRSFQSVVHFILKAVVYCSPNDSQFKGIFPLCW